jgi:hypothetical protein
VVCLGRSSVVHRVQFLNENVKKVAVVATGVVTSLLGSEHLDFPKMIISAGLTVALRVRQARWMSVTVSVWKSTVILIHHGRRQVSVRTLDAMQSCDCGPGA